MARHFRPNSLDLYKKVGTPLLKKERPSSNTEQTSFQYPNKPRVLSPVSIQKQTGRKGLQNYDQCHPSRFILFNDAPNSSSKTRKISTPSIRLYSPRVDRRSNNFSDQLDYSPQYSSIHKKISRQVMPWNKMTGRPKLKSKNLNNNSQPQPVRYKAIDKSVPTSNMNRETPRPEHEKIPSFMIKTPHRAGLKYISYKTLEMNNYWGRDCLGLTSTFGKSWKFVTKSASPVKGQQPKVVSDFKKQLLEKYNL